MTAPTPRTDAEILTKLVELANLLDFAGKFESAATARDASILIVKQSESLAAAQEALAAKNAALDFAEGAIEDAIYSEDGLEGDTGQRVIHIIQEARERGTFDKEKFGDSPKTRIELEADLAAAQEARQAAEERAESYAKDAEKLRRYRAFLIRFDDTDRPDELFVGEGAEDAAMRRWEQISVNWNAHLFRKILGNADATDRHAIADAAIAGEKPQGAST